jgi:hypothetical protein
MPRLAAHATRRKLDPDTVGGSDFSRRLRQGALEAIRQLNLQFLDLLCERAASSSPYFPLATSARDKLAVLTAERRASVASCGVLLADIAFSKINEWKGMPEEPEAIDLGTSESRWASHEQMSALTHSTLLVAWYIVQANTAVASVLLDMSEPVIAGYALLGLHDIALIAQERENWIAPRWAQNERAWLSLIDCGLDNGVEIPAFVALRVLQLCGGQTERLIDYLNH